MAPRTRHDRDYYATLGVDAAATAEDLRRAYRRLALRWHPDRNPGDPAAAERFREVSEAYAVLVDAGRRREYDRARRTGVPYDTGRSREDLFRDLFADPTASAVFEELAREFERLGLRVDRHRFHATLFGGRAVVTGGIFVIGPLAPLLALLGLRPGGPLRAGRRPPAAPAPPGAIAALRGAAAWLLRSASPEPRSGPSQPGLLARVAGRLLGSRPPRSAPGDLVVPLRLTAAEAARGGRRRVTLEHDGGPREVVVTVPPGVRSGTRLRLRGKGRAAPGQPPGDAYLAVEVADG